MSCRVADFCTRGRRGVGVGLRRSWCQRCCSPFTPTSCAGAGAGAGPITRWGAPNCNPKGLLKQPGPNVCDGTELPVETNFTVLYKQSRLERAPRKVEFYYCSLILYKNRKTEKQKNKSRRAVGGLKTRKKKDSSVGAHP